MPETGILGGLEKFFNVGSFGNPDIVPFEQRQGQIQEGLKSIRAGNLRGGRVFLKNGFTNMTPEQQQALLAGLSPADAQLVQSNVDDETGTGGIAQAFQTLFGGDQ